MTQDEIIEMALKAGIGFSVVNEFWGYSVLCETYELYEFAELVAAKEREACAQLCENFADQDSGPDGICIDYHAYLIRARGEA